MPGTPTSKYAIPTLAGTTLARDIDTETNAALSAIDSKMAGYSEAPIGSRPTSTVGTPGIAGREFYATDTKKRYKDNGTGWDQIPKIVGVATATWAPGAVAHGASASTAVAVTGAAAGDVVLVSHPSIIAGGLILTGQYAGGVSNINVTFANLSGGSVTPASGTLTVVVLRP